MVCENHEWYLLTTGKKNLIVVFLPFLRFSLIDILFKILIIAGYKDEWILKNISKPPFMILPIIPIRSNIVLVRPFFSNVEYRSITRIKLTSIIVSPYRMYPIMSISKSSTACSTGLGLYSIGTIVLC